MRLTRKKQNEYKTRILTELKNATGVDMTEYSLFYPTRKACETLQLSIYPHSSKMYVEVRRAGYFSYYYPEDLFCEVRHQPYKIISRKQFDNLVNSAYHPEEIIPSLEEWNNLVREQIQLDLKKLQNQKELNELQLEFDDKITLGEIRQEFPGLYVRYRKTKLTFHQWADSGMTRYWTGPVFTIKIKPTITDSLRIDNYVYNKRIFNQKLDEVNY
jgi:hypothetical protein